MAAPDVIAAAEALRRWLDDLSPDDDTDDADPRLVSWHRTHGPVLVAAANDLERLARPD